MCIAAFAVQAHAELYKWTDGQGQTHYSDLPPAMNAQTIKGSSAGQAETTHQARQSLNAKDQDYQKRRKAAEDARAKREKEAEEARVQRENCDKARKNLDTLQNSSRVYATDAAGQRSYMDEAARARALANSQKAVSDFCK